MPGHGSGTEGVAIAQSGVILTVVGNVYLGAITKIRSFLKNVQWAEVFAEVSDSGYW